METIPQQYKATEKENLGVLGMVWNLKRDTLKLKSIEKQVTQIDKSLTRRKVLRTIASVYDPCGFITPLLLPLKVFFQKLWKDKLIKWDTASGKDLIKEME